MKKSLVQRLKDRWFPAEHQPTEWQRWRESETKKQGPATPIPESYPVLPERIYPVQAVRPWERWRAEHPECEPRYAPLPQRTGENPLLLAYRRQHHADEPTQPWPGKHTNISAGSGDDWLNAEPPGSQRAALFGDVRNPSKPLVDDDPTVMTERAKKERAFKRAITGLLGVDDIQKASNQ